MKLKQWLTQNKVKAFHLSKVLNIPPATLHRHLIKERPIRGTTAVKIERYTKGEVTLRELVVEKRVNKKNEMV